MTASIRQVRLQTSRLVLRQYREGDYAALHAMSAEPTMWTYSERETMRPEESWTRLLRHAGHWLIAGYGLFALEDKQTGEFVGEAGCSGFRRQLGPDFDPWPEISWAIRPVFQGRGYAEEAAQAALKWLDATIAPERTVCLIHRENGASLRVAEKLGYKPFRELCYRGYEAILLSRGRGTGAEPDGRKATAQCERR